LRRFVAALEQLPLAGFLKDGTMLVHGNPAWPYEISLLGNPVQPSIGTFVFSKDYSTGGYHALWSDQALGPKIIGSRSRGSVEGPGFNNGSEVYLAACFCGISKICHGHCHKFYNQEILLVNGKKCFITSLISSAVNNLDEGKALSYCGLVRKDGKLILHKYSSEAKVFFAVKDNPIIAANSVATSSSHPKPKVSPINLPVSTCLLPILATSSSPSMFSCPTSPSKPTTYSQSSTSSTVLAFSAANSASDPLAVLPPSLLKLFEPPSTTLTQKPK
jgi:hypothetical protein